MRRTNENPNFPNHRDWTTLPISMTPSQTQIGGNHYKGHAIQPIEFILKNNLGFCEGNVVKYICRHKTKNGKQDIEKAIHYLQLLIEHEYPEK